MPSKPSKQLSEKVVRSGKLHSGKVTDTLDVKALPPKERWGRLTAARAEKVARELREKGKCPRCALTLSHCICSGLTDLAESVRARPELGVRFAVWMHVSERVRGSNTGKLMLHVLPRCELYLHGVQADLERFHAQTKHSKVYVLFPSENAAPLGVVAADIQLAAATAIETGIDTLDASPLVVLIDGTWDQARRMHRVLQDLPHVALGAPDGAKSSDFTWRQQSQDGRVTTAEAAALFLDGLTGTTADGAATAMAGALRKAVAMLDGALQTQTHYSKTEPPAPYSGGEWIGTGCEQSSALLTSANQEAKRLSVDELHRPANSHRNEVLVQERGCSERQIRIPSVSDRLLAKSNMLVRCSWLQTIAGTSGVFLALFAWAFRRRVALP